MPRSRGILRHARTPQGFVQLLAAERPSAAEQFHAVGTKIGFAANVFAGTALLSWYCRSRRLREAQQLFDEMPGRSAVTWNTLIYGHAQSSEPGLAVRAFRRMVRTGVSGSMLKAIGSSSSLLEGRQVHALILKTGYDSDVNVQNGLISMYARCGAIGESKDVFASVKAPDLVSWNSLLSGYAQHGYGKEVVEVFEQMRRLNVQPDHTTFLLVLTACSHVGLVDKGLEYFNLMKTNGFLAGARLEHYACMVDLLGRAGHLQEAESLINDMPIEPGVSVYRALLSACQIHGNLEIAIRVSRRLIKLYPHDSSAHVQLSKAFAGDGHWGNAAEIREAMTGKGIVKNPAWSCIEDRMQVG